VQFTVILLLKLILQISFYTIVLIRHQSSHFIHSISFHMKCPRFFQTGQNRAHAVQRACVVRAGGAQTAGRRRVQGAQRVQFARKRRALQSPACPPAARQVLGSCQLLWSVASRLQTMVLYWFEPDRNLISSLSRQSFDFLKIRVHIQILRQISLG
jgi:hypothetical protein